MDKAHYKKLNIKQNIDERDELIDQLLVQSLDLNDKVSNNLKFRNSKLAIIMHTI